MTAIKLLQKTEQIISGLLGSVRKMIAKSELSNYEPIPYVQPIFQSSTLAGCEVLLRLKRDGVSCGPEVLLKKIESTDLINDVTCLLLDKVRNYFILHQDDFPAGFYFSFNICAHQLNSDKLLRAVNEFNKQLGEERYLVLEIVERGTIDLDDFALEAMEALISQGVRFAIDDFGSGSSSLKYIEHTGFSMIKIDKSLTVSCRGALVYPSVIDSIMTIANNLGVQLVAEGVETQEQLSLLMDKGVNMFQGYLFSRPVSMEVFSDACT